MLSGLHTIIYSADADKDRQFLSDLGLNSVDAGGGWPIYAVPPSEIAVHPLHGEGQKPGTGLYFMVDDVHAAIEAFKKKKVNCSAIVEHPWGSLTTITLPSGTTVDCYQPKHARPTYKAAASKKTPMKAAATPKSPIKKTTTPKKATQKKAITNGGTRSSSRLAKK